MQLIIETCLQDFYLGLVSQEKTIFHIHKKNLIKKSDELPLAFSRLLESLKIQSNQITDIFVTTGPGSFMGVRAGLLFAITFCQITKAKLHTIDSLTFLSAGEKGQYYLDAKSNQSFFLDYPKQSKIQIIYKHEDSKMNYELLIKSPSTYQKLFKQTNPLDAKANYIKEPKVG